MTENITAALEVEIYAPGLRVGDRLLQLAHQMDLLPGIRYKIDAPHELVYLEADAPGALTQNAAVAIFEAIGIAPRFVGDINALLPISEEDTQPLFL
jgi:hypothetical protein